MGTTKIVRWLFSITVAFALIFGTAGHAFATPPAHAEKVDVLVSFTGKPGPAEQALIHNAGGKVKRNYHIVPTIAASIQKVGLTHCAAIPK